MGVSPTFSAENHYVPRWYQQQFIPSTAKERKYYYLDLHPEKLPKSGGGHYVRDELRFLGPVNCFKQSNLYTMQFGQIVSDELEKKFFGRIDDHGSLAVPFFHNWQLAEDSREMLHDFIDFMCIQSMRTPKGLDLLKFYSRAQSHQDVLATMTSLWQMNMTIWMEGIWEIVQCKKSTTKFIVSDHPVASYNRGMFPLSNYCNYPRDAHVAALGTHTLFPLGPDHLLVITNLGYVRDPGVNPTKARENERYFAQTMFDMTHVQTGREISERDVIAINYILKNRSRRFVAAPDKEWLYPERRLQSLKWDKLGGRFFLMPDPRKVKFHTETFMGFASGEAMGMDEYGRPVRRLKKEEGALREREWVTFQRHKQAWDTKYGKLSREELRKLF